MPAYHHHLITAPVRFVTITSGLVALLCCFSGCVERRESITVHPDGSCSITIEYQSGNPEFDGVPMPAAAEGWTVERSETIRGGEKRFLASATKTFAPGAVLPTFDGPGDSPQRADGLRYRTAIRVDAQPDGTYFHFERVYEGRPWAWWNPAEDEQKARAAQKRLEAKAGRMTPEEWTAEVRSLVRMQTKRKLIVARRAFREVSPTGSQGLWLTAHAAVMKECDGMDLSEMVALLQAPQSQPRDVRLGEVVRRIEQQIDSHIEKRLVDAGYDEKSLAAFQSTLRRSRQFNAATTSLGGVSTNVVVELPGELVGANADSQSGSTATWRLSADMFHDRSPELLATSKADAK